MKRAINTGHHAPLGLRTVAAFEFAKGLLVLVAGLGLLSMVHRDAQIIAENLVRHFHLNPAHHYPQIFIHTAADLNDARLWWLSVAALIYSTVRFVEAYGLWHERAWAEWFAIISAGMYLPVEIYEFWEKRNAVRGSVFIVNLGIVIYLAWLLAVNHRRKVAAEAACARAGSAD
ncbi:MAG TPA: DUF2127 domain-containing protein [Verrucomicrobiae bacterium]|nr:DUF2127 domain-containing protein [Verrucomicrobiae bacterium]